MTFWCQWISNMSHPAVLLDLSAAFGTIHHNKLIQRLESDCGVTGDALAWFRSYLSDRFQRVSVNGGLSKRFPMSQEVPQGSCWGPDNLMLNDDKAKFLIHRIRADRRIRFEYASCGRGDSWIWWEKSCGFKNTRKCVEGALVSIW